MKRFSVAINRYKKRVSGGCADCHVTSDGVKIPQKYQQQRNAITIDEKTILYIVNRYIRAEYGRRGGAAVVAQACKKNVLIVSVESALWAQEVWMRRNDIIAQVNNLCGDHVVTKIIADVR